MLRLFLLAGLAFGGHIVGSAAQAALNKASITASASQEGNFMIEGQAQRGIRALIIPVAQLVTTTTTDAPAPAQEQDTTEAPTHAPSQAPAQPRAQAPTNAPDIPTAAPTGAPTAAPTGAPTNKPTAAPTDPPTDQPTAAPTDPPTDIPTAELQREPQTQAPTEAPTQAQSQAKINAAPTVAATTIAAPTAAPTAARTEAPIIPTDTNSITITYPFLAQVYLSGTEKATIRAQLTSAILAIQIPDVGAVSDFYSAQDTAIFWNSAEGSATVYFTTPYTVGNTSPAAVEQHFLQAVAGAASVEALALHISAAVSEIERAVSPQAQTITATWRQADANDASNKMLPFCEEQAAKVDGVINAEQATTVNGAINGKGAKVSSKGAKKATRMRRDHGKSAKTSEKPSVDNEAKLTNTVGNKKHGHQHHHSHGGDAADGSTNMGVADGSTDRVVPDGSTDRVVPDGSTDRVVPDGSTAGVVAQDCIPRGVSASMHYGKAWGAESTVATVSGFAAAGMVFAAVAAAVHSRKIHRTLPTDSNAPDYGTAPLLKSNYAVPFLEC